MAIHFCSQMSTSVAMATMFAMLIQTVTTQMVLIFVHARKDTLEMDSHVKVNKSNLQYFKTSSFAHKLSPTEISPHFKGLFSHTTLVHSITSPFMLLDIDECRNESHDCDINANCTNTNGSHICTCKEGYTGKGGSCQGTIRLDFEKKQNNCSLQIIALLSNKLAKIFFLFSVTIYKSIVFIDIDECNDDSHVCDSNANCTNTNGSHNSICKVGNIINGQSCQ